jgi:hypothetical protein
MLLDKQPPCSGYVLASGRIGSLEERRSMKISRAATAHGLWHRAWIG